MEILTDRGPGAGNGQAPVAVTEATTATFAADVLEASRDTVIVVDFWAPWCGPCRQLTPLLEKVIGESAGRARLVKVNVDENQAIAAQLGVQSIPAVFAFKDGRPVDGFLGALPESQVRQFIDRIAGDVGAAATEALAAADAALAAGDARGAAEVYTALLREDPRHTAAIAGLARCQIAQGAFTEARRTLSLAPPDKAEDADIKSAIAALELAEGAEEAAANLGPLEAKVAANPKDHQARIDLAVALNAAGQREAALDHLLESIKTDKEWQDGAARKQLLTFFEAWGPTDPLTQAGRRRLSSVLFA